MPGTSTEIQKAYVNQFRQGFDQAFQQTQSVLEPYFEYERQSSEFEYYDRIGVADDMQEDTSRYGDNPMSEIEHDRRRIGLRDYELGKYIEEKDLLRVITDPMNPYNQAFLASGNRKKDDIIISRIFGPAYRGKKGETTVNFVTTPSSGKVKVGALSKGHSNPITSAGRYELQAGEYEGIAVAKDYVSSGVAADSGLTLDKLKAMKFTMMRLDAITQDTILPIFLGTRQFEDLFEIDEVINADYAVRKSLAEGKVTTFMGFQFIHCPRLLTDSDGARRCIVALPKAFKLAVAKDLQINMWRDSSKKNAPYMYMNMAADGSRMWGEICGEIKCVEA